MQSESALLRRLLRRGFSGDVATAAVAKIREYGYVDDQKLAASVAGRKQRSGFGSRRITADLRGRGLDQDTIDTALNLGEPLAVADANQQALDLATDHWLKRHGAPGDRKSRDRLAGHLVRRGFGMSDVIRACNQAASPDEQ